MVKWRNTCSEKIIMSIVCLSRCNHLFLLCRLLDATLLRKVCIKSDGQMAVTVATSSLKHDVTGGIREKLQTALNIIRISEKHTRVFVVNILSDAVAYSACTLGVLDGSGTEILPENQESTDAEIQ